MQTQADILKRQSSEQRLQTAQQLYEMARVLKRSSLRQQHPEWTERELDQAVARVFLHAQS